VGLPSLTQVRRAKGTRRSGPQKPLRLIPNLVGRPKLLKLGRFRLARNRILFSNTFRRTPAPRLSGRYRGFLPRLGPRRRRGIGQILCWFTRPTSRYPPVRADQAVGLNTSWGSTMPQGWMERRRHQRGRVGPTATKPPPYPPPTLSRNEGTNGQTRRSPRTQAEKKNVRCHHEDQNDGRAAGREREKVM